MEHLPENNHTLEEKKYKKENENWSIPGFEILFTLMAIMLWFLLEEKEYSSFCYHIKKPSTISISKK
ncbi:MAG: hypothetical protein V5A68_07185 [Candidatus Thermoplasmatota archaeon]